MSDKRSVATDALETLGTAPLDDKQKRDAIHLAVEPVIAGQRLEAGDHITIADGMAFQADEGDDVTIIDKVVTQSSDSEYHCLTVTLFYARPD